MKKIEAVLWSFLIILVFFAKIDAIALAIVAIPCFLLSAFYFIFSYKLINGNAFSIKTEGDKKDNTGFIVVLSGVLYALSVISILFKLLHFPGSFIVTSISFISLCFMFVISLKNRETLDVRFNHLIYRYLIFLIILLFLVIIC